MFDEEVRGLVEDLMFEMKMLFWEKRGKKRNQRDLKKGSWT